MEPLTVDELIRALKRTETYSGMSDSELQEFASYIMGFFGFDDQIIDNVLMPRDRGIFFALEEEGFLTSTQEDSSIPSGKAWRIHYWRLKTRKIRELARAKDEVEDEENIYDSIPEDAWVRRS
jgi:hypothetical protein